MLNRIKRRDFLCRAAACVAGGSAIRTIMSCGSEPVTVKSLLDSTPWLETIEVSRAFREADGTNRKGSMIIGYREDLDRDGKFEFDPGILDPADGSTAHFAVKIWSDHEEGWRPIEKGITDQMVPAYAVIGVFVENYTSEADSSRG